MALEKKYIIRQDHYDYFGGHKTYTYVAHTPIEAFAIYRKERRHDFDYGDAFNTTYPPTKAVYIYTSDPQRYHAREKWAWEEICTAKNEKTHDDAFLSEEEVAYLMSLIPDDELLF